MEKVVEKIIECEKGGAVVEEWAKLPFGAAVASWIGVFREQMPKVPRVVSERVMRTFEALGLCESIPGRFGVLKGGF